MTCNISRAIMQMTSNDEMHSNTFGHQRSWVFTTFACFVYLMLYFMKWMCEHSDGLFYPYMGHWHISCIAYIHWCEFANMWSPKNMQYPTESPHWGPVYTNARLPESGEKCIYRVYAIKKSTGSKNESGFRQSRLRVNGKKWWIPVPGIKYW